MAFYLGNSKSMKAVQYDCSHSKRHAVAITNYVLSCQDIIMTGVQSGSSSTLKPQIHDCIIFICYLQVVTKDAIFNICKSVIHSGKEYVRMKKSHSPLMYAYYGTEYLGEYHDATLKAA